MPATALVGATTDEARFIARRVARTAGVPFVVMDVSRLQPGGLRRGSARGPDLILPPDPVVAMSTSGCANPLVLVIGAENAIEDLSVGLGDLLDRHSSARWFCNALGAVLDLSAVNWMVATSNEHALHTRVYTRVTPVPIAVPTERAGRLSRVLTMALEIMAYHDLRVEEVREALASMINDADGAWDVISRCAAGALHEAVTRLLLRAAYEFENRSHAV